MKDEDPQFEDPDVGIDNGYFRACTDGFPIPAGAAAEEIGDIDENHLSLSEGVRAHLNVLVQLERTVSEQRRLLHARIDFIRTQDLKSYAFEQQIAYLLNKERALSDRRTLLQREIDQIRGVNDVRKSRRDSQKRKAGLPLDLDAGAE